MGMLEEAIVEFQNARACSSNHPATLAALGHAYASMGQRHQAEELLLELEGLSGKRPISAYSVALLRAGLGETCGAVKWLEKARDERDVWLVWLRVEPRFDPLRSDARLHNLMRTVHPDRRN
jgi:Flp pilus assembly protein TadD